jgi:hypothetical protein
MSIDIVRLEVEDILKDYSEIEPEVAKALDHSSGEWTPLQVIQGAITDPALMHIWYVYDDGERVATGSTRIVQYNNFVAIHIITLGGKTNDKLIEWTEEFTEMMKEYTQIDCVEFTGRRGLVRPLERAGWKERYVTMRKSLKEDFTV